MKIITIGGATQDIFIHYQDGRTIEFHRPHEDKTFLLFEEGAKVEVKTIDYSTGGGATNSATSFKQLGFDVSAFFKVGSDTQGKFVIDHLMQEGVNTDLVVFGKERTGVSFVIPTLRGDRTIFAYRGTNAFIKENELPFDAIKQTNYLYITSLSGTSSQLLLPITKEAKKHDISVANNPGISQLAAGADILRESLSNIDILILNSSEAKQFMVSLVQTDEELQRSIAQIQKVAKKAHEPALLSGTISFENISFSLVHFFHEVLQRGPKIVVVTNGPEGVYVATEQTIYFHPSLPVKIKNTLGAGDAFGSCFVGSIARDSSVQQAIVNGIINATSVISKLDAKEGLLTWDELEKRAKKVGLKKLQKFPLSR